MPVHCTCISTWSSRWPVRIQVQVPRAKYKYKYSGFVLEYNSSTSTSTKYYISAVFPWFKNSNSNRALEQPSWRHLTRWLSMLDSHHMVNSSRLRRSPTAQSTGMLFSSWASCASDWWRRPGIFEHLRCCVNGFPLWCSDSVLLCCTMVLLMMSGQSRVHCQTNHCQPL